MAWKYFTKDEMKCKHCGECKMDEQFMSLLDALRTYVGKPLSINSGYRCPVHDKAEGGKGNHTSGMAADIRCESSDVRFLIIKGAIMLGFTRIGIGKDFIHLDRVAGQPQQVVWLY